METRVQRSFIQGSEVLKPAPKLTRALCHIDWNDTTTAIYNLVRGLSPYPTAFTELVRIDGTGTPQQLKIFFGEAVTGEALESMRSRSIGNADSPGSILSDGKTFFAVTTADGALSITDMQLSGKKRMDVKAFLAGFRNPEQFTTTAGTSMEEIRKVSSSTR